MIRFLVGTLLFTLVLSKSTNPVKQPLKDESFSATLMRRLDAHMNETESYLKQNSALSKAATVKLNDMTKSLGMLSKNVGSGEFSTNTLQKLENQVEGMILEQSRQKNDLHSLFLKIGLVLDYLPTQKEAIQALKKSIDSQKNEIATIDSKHREAMNSVNDLKNIINTRFLGDIKSLETSLNQFNTENKKTTNTLLETLNQIKKTSENSHVAMKNHVDSKIKECKVAAPPPPPAKVVHGKRKKLL